MISEVGSFNRVLAYWKKKGANVFKIERKDGKYILKVIRQSAGDYWGRSSWKQRIDSKVVISHEVSPDLNLPEEYFKGVRSIV